jgi:hypothetical protein
MHDGEIVLLSTCFISTTALSSLMRFGIGVPTLKVIG